MSIVTLDRSSRLAESCPESADEYRPTYEMPYIPNAWSEAFYLGLSLGLEGEPAIRSYETRSLNDAFLAGWLAGSRQYEREAAEYVAMLEAEAELDGELHAIEAIEGRGVLVYRKEGGQR